MGVANKAWHDGLSVLSLHDDIVIFPRQAWKRPWMCCRPRSLHGPCLTDHGAQAPDTEPWSLFPMPICSI
jgi:hypothetical protein